MISVGAIEEVFPAEWVSIRESGLTAPFITSYTLIGRRAKDLERARRDVRSAIARVSPRLTRADRTRQFILLSDYPREGHGLRGGRSPLTNYVEAWPTMTVAQRIACGDFTKQMSLVRFVL